MECAIAKKTVRRRISSCLLTGVNRPRRLVHTNCESEHKDSVAKRRCAYDLSYAFTWFKRHQTLKKNNFAFHFSVQLVWTDPIGDRHMIALFFSSILSRRLESSSNVSNRLYVPSQDCIFLTVFNFMDGH